MSYPREKLSEIILQEYAAQRTAAQSRSKKYPIHVKPYINRARSIMKTAYEQARTDQQKQAILLAYEDFKNQVCELNPHNGFDKNYKLALKELKNLTGTCCGVIGMKPKELKKDENRRLSARKSKRVVKFFELNGRTHFSAIIPVNKKYTLNSHDRKIPGLANGYFRVSGIIETNDEAEPNIKIETFGSRHGCFSPYDMKKKNQRQEGAEQAVIELLTGYAELAYNPEQDNYQENPLEINIASMSLMSQMDKIVGESTMTRDSFHGLDAVHGQVMSIELNNQTVYIKPNIIKFNLPTNSNRFVRAGDLQKINKTSFNSFIEIMENYFTEHPSSPYHRLYQEAIYLFNTEYKSAEKNTELQVRILLCLEAAGFFTDIWCKSGKDRTGYMNIKMEAYHAYLREHGEFPRLGERAVIGSQINQLENSIYKNSIAKDNCELNRPGCAGLIVRKKVPWYLKPVNWLNSFLFGQSPMTTNMDEGNNHIEDVADGRSVKLGELAKAVFNTKAIKPKPSTAPMSQPRQGARIPTQPHNVSAAGKRAIVTDRTASYSAYRTAPAGKISSIIACGDQAQNSLPAPVTPRGQVC